jgi:hypothetical protein
LNCQAITLAPEHDQLFAAFQGAELSGGRGDKGLSTRDDYRQNAFECLRLARSTTDHGDRTMLVGMAQTWVKLADQAATISSLGERAAVEGSRG